MITKNDLTKQDFRIVLSAGSLSLLVLYILSIVLGDQLLNTYWGRDILLQTSVLTLPYLLLFTLTLIESKLHINKRLFVWSIFLLYTLRFILFAVGGNTSLQNPVFLNSALNRMTTVAAFVEITHLVLAIIIPVANKWVVRVYAISMLTILSVSLGYLAFSTVPIPLEDLNRYLFAILADIFFNATLFFAGDWLTDENRLFWKGTNIMREKLWNPFREKSFPEHPLCDNYKDIVLFAAEHNMNEFIRTEVFFDRLSKSVYYDESDRQYYTTDEYVRHIKALHDLALTINEKQAGVISKDFIQILEMVLYDKNEPFFKKTVAGLARLFLDLPSRTDDLDLLDSQGGNDSEVVQ